MTALADAVTGLRAGAVPTRRQLVLVAAGMLLLQLVWIFSVPVFRGSDEFDHVYRAAAVARGHWDVAPTAATRGTGAWVLVPDDIVRAARPQCESLVYTKDADCRGTAAGPHTRRIASGAGRYHPLYYALVGTPALPFSGHAAVYVMRLVSALLCWALFILALWAARQWARTPWPTIGAAVAAAPVLVYSASIVAPNGLELMAALAFWMSLLGLGRAETSPRPLLLAAAVSGSLLVTTRSLGPLWCAMIGLSCLLACWPSRQRWQTLLRDRVTWAAAGVLALFSLQSLWWIENKGSLRIGVVGSLHLGAAERLQETAKAIPLWVFQSIAAFPLRDERSPIVLYAAYLLVFGLLLVLGLRAAGTRLRATIVLSALAAVAVPALITFSTYNQYAESWQGRYGLPYSLGLVVLCSAALDATTSPPGPVLRVAIAVPFVIGQVVGPVSVLHRLLPVPLSDYDWFLHLPVALTAVVAALAASLLIAAVLPATRFTGATR